MFSAAHLTSNIRLYYFTSELCTYSQFSSAPSKISAPIGQQKVFFSCLFAVYEMGNYRSQRNVVINFDGGKEDRRTSAELQLHAYTPAWDLWGPLASC